MPRTTKGKTVIIKTYGGLRDPKRESQAWFGAQSVRQIRRPHAEPVTTSVKNALTDGYVCRITRE